jgi:superfamily I DNA/RNA helicase
LADGDKAVAESHVRAAAEKDIPLADVIPAADRAAVLKEAAEWAAQRAADEDQGDAEPTPKVKVTSFEGAKGLSAQYVFLIGLQSGDLPRSATNVQDIEICRFLVGMTRTKKKCSILTTRRFGDKLKESSEFLSWIADKRFDRKRVDAAYWKK